MKSKNILNVAGNDFVFATAKQAALAFELLSDATEIKELIYARGEQSTHEDFPKDLYQESTEQNLQLNKRPVKFATEEQIEIEKQAKADYEPTY